MSIHVRPQDHDVTPDRLKGFHRSFATGVTILTSIHGDTPAGIAVNAFSSVSIDPAIVLVCVSQRSSFLDVIDRTRTFGVNVLSEDQSALAMRFGRPGPNKFDAVAWTTAPNGSPWIAGAAARLEATFTQFLDAGTHRICLGAVTAIDLDDRHPLIYRDGRMFQSGRLSEATLAC